MRISVSLEFLRRLWDTLALRMLRSDLSASYFQTSLKKRMRFVVQGPLESIEEHFNKNINGR